MEILNYKKTEIQNSYVDFKASMDAVVERVEEAAPYFCQFSL